MLKNDNAADRTSARLDRVAQVAARAEVQALNLNNAYAISSDY